MLLLLLQVKEYKEAAARLPAVLREAKELEGQQAKLQQALEQADGLRAAVEQLREQVCSSLDQSWHQHSLLCGGRRIGGDLSVLAMFHMMSGRCSPCTTGY
jgi:hypothetical protein